MKIIGWLFVLLLTFAIFGFFFDWCDVKKDQGCIEFSLNTVKIAKDCKDVCHEVKNLFKKQN